MRLLKSCIAVTAAFSQANSELIRSMSLMTTEQSARGILDIVENSTREKDGGTFINVDGTRWDW